MEILIIKRARVGHVHNRAIIRVAMIAKHIL